MIKKQNAQTIRIFVLFHQSNPGTTPRVEIIQRKGDVA